MSEQQGVIVRTTGRRNVLGAEAILLCAFADSADVAVLTTMEIGDALFDTPPQSLSEVLIVFFFKVPPAGRFSSS